MLGAKPLGLVLIACCGSQERSVVVCQGVARILHRHRLITWCCRLACDEDALPASERGHHPAQAACAIQDALEAVANHKDLNGLPVGLLGAGSGAAAMLRAAAVRPDRIGAIVALGGSLDLPAETLARVDMPTLLVVGGHDHEALAINRAAGALLGGLHRLEIVPGASHDFHEPAALDTLTYLASGWFRSYLRDRTNR